MIVDPITLQQWESEIHSQFIFVFSMFMDGNLVQWRRKKQPTVARSSEKAEFWSMVLGIWELLWLKSLLKKLKVEDNNLMKLYCDNKAVISIAHNFITHGRTKHVEVNQHLIKKKIGGGWICTPFVPSRNQLVYVLTKGLFKQQFQVLISKMEIMDITKLAWRGVLGDYHTRILQFHPMYPCQHDMT